MDHVHIQHKAYNDYIDLLKIGKRQHLSKHIIVLCPKQKSPE